MAAMVGGSGSLNGLSQEAQCELFPKGVAAFIECGEETKCSSLLKGSVSQLLQSAALECGPEGVYSLLGFFFGSEFKCDKYGTLRA